MRPPHPSAIAGVAWRALTGADAELLHALLRASEIADAMPYATSLDETSRLLAEPELDLAVDTLAGLAPDGSLACFGTARLRANATRRRSLTQDGHVHPEWRRRGLGGAVLDWTEQRGRARLAEAGGDVPTFLEVWCDERSADRRALFERRDYRPIRYYDDMRRALSEPLPEPAPEPRLPDGLTLSRYTPEMDEALREAHNTAFRDHWGSEPFTPEQWRHHFTGSPYFRPDLTVIAVDGAGRIAGYVIGYHSPDDIAVTGRVEGWLGQVGTLREWRGRGVATALMRVAMQEMAAAGMDHAALDVDSENPSGAVGLYERLGFARMHRWVRWAKPAVAPEIAPAG